MTEKIAWKELDQRVEPDMYGQGDNNQTLEVAISHCLAGPNARLIGKPGGLRELTTPALVLDLEAFEQNVRAYQHQINLHGLQARPHAKSHKCAEIARRQIAAGAVGVCSQKVSEAEALVAGGVADVLVTNEIVGKTKVARLARLAHEAKVAVLADDAGNVADLDAAARAGGRRTRGPC